MVQAPNGVGYTMRRGACIGKNGGTVAAVRSGEVVIAEWAVRADGPATGPRPSSASARGGAEPRGVAPMKIHLLRLAVLLSGALGVPARAAEPNAIRALDVAERDGAIEVSIQGNRPPSSRCSDSRIRRASSWTWPAPTSRSLPRRSP